jgi:transcriptional regulator
MYVPSAFAETRIDVLHDFLRRHDFATVVTAGQRGLIASHVPVVLIPKRGERGAIQFHLAKPNEQCEDLAAGASALAIFQGPHGYVSPKWYANPLRVPTWNYIVVHASGAVRVLCDEELAYHLKALVSAYEPRDGGWTTDALPVDLFDKLRHAVVGFEMEIATLQGKWKLGQNRTREDREGAIAGLRSVGTHESSLLADLMAAAMEK